LEWAYAIARRPSSVCLSVCLSVRPSVCKLCANRFFYHKRDWIATKLAHDGPHKSPHPGCAQGQGQGQRSRDTDTFLRTLKSLLLPQTWLDRHQTCTRWSPVGPASRVCSRSRSRSKVTWYGHFSAYTKIASSTTNMTLSPPNLHTMVPSRACIQGVLKVKVKVKGHVIRTLFCVHLNRFFYHKRDSIATKLAHDGPHMGLHPGCAQGQGQGQRSRYTGTSVMSRNVCCTVPSGVLSLHALTLWNTIILSFQYKYQAAVYILEWATPSLTVWLQMFCKCFILHVTTVLNASSVDGRASNCEATFCTTRINKGAMNRAVEKITYRCIVQFVSYLHISEYSCTTSCAVRRLVRFYCCN